VIFSRIMSTGSYLPEHVMTNAELEGLVDTSDEWIRERTGIHQRHIVADGESTCDLAERAARAALETADVDPSELDLIVVGTTTPDKIYPATACRLQARLGANGCTAFDLQAVCTGFIYALGVADKFIKAGGVKRALVVGADTHSRLLDSYCSAMAAARSCWKPATSRVFTRPICMPTAAMKICSTWRVVCPEVPA
jgi:3-oxoacyl-[acyl-carrier-protein] synthase-3